MRAFFPLALIFFSSFIYGTLTLSSHDLSTGFKAVHLPLDKPCVAVSSTDVLAARADMVLETGDVGLTREQLIAAFRFIETRTRKGFPIYTASKTKLPCQIEYSKVLHGHIIRKIRGRGALIGHGFHKTVTKVILYGPCPKVLAECSTDSSAKGEIYALKKVHRAHGIVPFYGAVKRGKKYSIFLKYFSQGSLLHRFNMGQALNESEVMKIALDISKGLQALHKKKLVHQDLHSGNVLLDISSHSCNAVLVDFGKTLRVSMAKGSMPQAGRFKNPPEVLLVPLKKIDRYSADVYALGCLFYQMVWGKLVPWADLYNVYRLRDYKYSQRKGMHAKCVRRYKDCIERNIGEILRKKKQGLPITKYDKFKLLIFKMIDFNSKNRPSANKVVSLLDG